MPENYALDLHLDNDDILSVLYGERDSNLKYISEQLNVEIYARGNNIYIKGTEKQVLKAKKILSYLADIAVKKKFLDHDYITSIITKMSITENLSDDLIIKTRKKDITPLTKNQLEYFKVLNTKPITICTGPAGTGKTYIAIAFAVNMFLSKQVDRIILSRPAVEAGEKIGFLPGDIKEKVDPYLRPLYDALYDMLPADLITKLIQNGEIEVAPLAFMRGRTLNNAFIVLDEAQNATIPQMKMFLTRIGQGSKMVITGDPTQLDLPEKMASGLKDAVLRLNKIPEIGFVAFTEKDVVRHNLITKIIKAYERKDKEE